jgi:hypothetical protein
MFVAMRDRRTTRSARDSSASCVAIIERERPWIELFYPSPSR